MEIGGGARRALTAHFLGGTESTATSPTGGYSAYPARVEASRVAAWLASYRFALSSFDIRTAGRAVWRR